MKIVTKRGISFSGITLGTVQLGKDYGISNHKGKPAVETAFQLLEAASRRHINVFDTAQNYGDAERILGDFFNGREKPVIMSKMNIDHNMLRQSSADLLKSITLLLESTLEKLRIPCLPILFIHNTESLQGAGNKIRAALESLKRVQLIDKAGISFSVIDIEQEFETVWPWIQDDVFETIQIPINLLDNRLLHNYLDQLKTIDKIVFARSVFLQGLILMNPEDVPPYMQQAVPFLRHLDRICDKSGLSRDQLAFSYVRDLPVVDSILIGVDSMEQLENNLSLIDGPAIPERFLQEIQTGWNIPDWIVTPFKWPSK